jgi:saccharopine dehydrogenase-like NADP-dependent oxidoreductase
MKENILVIGGYGQVGRHVCLELAKAVPGRVVAAGRDFEKAKAFAETTNGAVLPREVDITRDADEDLFDDVKLVVVCVPQEDPAFVEACLNSGTHYIDITEIYDFLSQVERLNDLAQSRGATAQLSVGLSPGLTNLLVKHCVSQLDSAARAEIYLMIGDGNEHGDTLNDLMLEHMTQDIEIPGDGSIQRYKPFTDGKKTTFPDGLGRHRAYRYEFPEPHVLPRTLGLQRVSHRTCTDSRFTTWMMHALSRVGFWKLLRFASVKSAVKKGMSGASGSDVIAIKVIVSGESGGEPVTLEASATGRDVNLNTGRFAAIIAEEIYSGGYPTGVHHVEELFALSDVRERMEENLRFHLDETPELVTT